MSFQIYYPELKEAKPVAQIEAALSHYGKHYFLDTPLTLPAGRGIEFIKTYKAEDLNQYGQRKVGWNYYKVTRSAFEKICQQYQVSCEALLD